MNRKEFSQKRFLKKHDPSLSNEPHYHMKLSLKMAGEFKIQLVGPLEIGYCSI
jgi:hypothetical protein